MSKGLKIAACVCFLFSAFGGSFPVRASLVPLGLGLWVLSELI